MNEDSKNKAQGNSNDIEALLGVLPVDVALAVRQKKRF